MYKMLKKTAGKRRCSYKPRETFRSGSSVFKHLHQKKYSLSIAKVLTVIKLIKLRGFDIECKLIIEFQIVSFETLFLDGKGSVWDTASAEVSSQLIPRSHCKPKSHEIFLTLSANCVDKTNRTRL